MIIPLVNLARQNSIYEKDYLQAIKQVIRKADFILGQKVADFENQFAKFCHKKYCVGVNSGTDALFLGLKAYGIGKGDEVIIPPNTFFATAEAVENTGAKVVFADVLENTFTIDPNQITKHIHLKQK